MIRHSWLSNGRRESVAEHTWRMSLMFLLVEPHLGITVDAKKTPEMIIIHEIIEALVGDIPAFEQFNTETKLQKIKMETEAIEEIRRTLDRWQPSKNWMLLSPHINCSASIPEALSVIALI